MRGRLATAVAVVSLLAASGAAIVLAPSEDDVQSPIENRGALGEVVESRQVSVEASAVTVAEDLEIEGGGPDTTTSGAWVVVDLTVVCLVQQCDLGASLLRVGDRTFAASTALPFPSFSALRGGAGIPYSTAALFEIPLDALEEPTADLLVQPARTGGLDSVAVVGFDLPSTVAPSARVRQTVIAGER